MNKELEKVIVITGPTGSGKTEFSLKLAMDINGEIINCDASQMKKDLNIGTAKLDLSKTQVKHHLIDFLEADENYSIRDFQVKGRDIITDIIKRGKVPIIVGGTGLYINALLYDYDLNDEERNPEFEKKYKDVDNHSLHVMLENLDKDLANQIHENNRRRVLRALEKTYQDKVPLKTNKILYNAKIFCLDVDRSVLYERINSRVLKMLENGWIEECQNLKRSNFNLEKIKDIGYPEVFKYLDNIITKEEMIDKIQQKTRNYAKRQITWFKNKLDCDWIKLDYNCINKTYEELLEKSIDFIKWS